MATSNLLDLGHDVVVRVDGPLGSVLAGQLKLLLRTSRADDLGTDGPKQLHKERSDASSGGMDKHPLAGLDLASLPDEGPGRETLQVDGYGRLIRDALRDGDETLGGHGAVLSIGAGGAAHVDDALADGEARASGRLDNLTGSLAAEDKRELRGLVQAGAEVGVDVVDAGEDVAHEDVGVGRLGHGNVDVLQDFDAAVLGDLDGLHCRWNRSHGCNEPLGGESGNG